MIPVVNHQFHYILFYSAKAASSALRELFLALHAEPNDSAIEVGRYHALNEEFGFCPGHDYSSYYRFLITRNPYSRLISAYLDQFVYAGKSLRAMQGQVSEEPAGDASFVEFLELLTRIPDAERDSHFQTQAGLYGYAEFAGVENQDLDYVGDVKDFNRALRKIYRHIFAQAPQKYALLESLTDGRGKRNSLYYAGQAYPSAANLNADALRDMVAPPRPQDFYADRHVRQLVQSLYATDFELFGYAPESIPEVTGSGALGQVPDDFDWRTYLELNPDLPLSGIDSERAVIRHYLEFGRFESIPRAYRVVAPAGFKWRNYLQKNPDLSVAGICDKRSAIVHYLGFGIRERREF